MSTTWIERFRQALAIMCGTRPPLHLCLMWARNQQDSHGSDPLQDWVLEQPALPGWSQGIVTIEAAQTWADQPVEGEGHQERAVDEMPEPRPVVQPSLPERIEHFHALAQELVEEAQRAGVVLSIRQETLPSGNLRTHIEAASLCSHGQDHECPDCHECGG